MDEKLRKLIDKRINELPEWIDTINAHSSMFDPSKNLSQDEQTNITYEVADVFAKISEICFQYGGFRDTFDNSKMTLHVYGLELIIQSKKMESEFCIGIDNKGIYLTTYMRYAEYLRHMGDSFYQSIFTLMDLGDFEIEESQFYAGPNIARYDELMKGQKSKIFRLLRNYFIGITEEERDIYLGEFHIQWSYKTNFYDVIYNCCRAFKILYKLNYSLWKIHDLKIKN